MKIKTITCHNVYNVGASLQAYALSHYLKSLGNDVEIIDYKPDYLSGHYRLWGGINPAYNKALIKELYCLAKFPGRLKKRFEKRKGEFDSFTKEFLPLTKRYKSLAELHADPPQADVYFAGSDQIWNTLFQNGRDPAFYLEFAPEGSVRASYAASFASDAVDDDFREQVTEWISHLDYVSVRESTGLAILHHLGIEGGQQVLDPVFLLDKQQWSRMSIQWKGALSEPYVLVYDFDNDSEIATFAKNIADKNHWKVVSMLKNRYIPTDFSQEGPIAFLTLIQNARAVVSNSFHATAFSVIFQKEFWVFYRNENINTRMADLLSLMGLSDRLIGKYHSAALEKKIDYENVNKKMEAEIVKSKAFIFQVLSEITVKRMC